MVLSCISPLKRTVKVSFTHTTTTVLTCTIKDIKNNTRKYEESQNEFWEVRYDDGKKKYIGRLFDQVEVESEN